MVQQADREHDPPQLPPVTPPNKNQPLGGSPGLLTSTGGLYATSGLLLIPITNTITGRNGIIIVDSNNFDCEEDCEYNTREEAPEGQQGRSLQCNLIILKYRELGQAKFTIRISGYSKVTDSFISKDIIVQIPDPNIKYAKQRFQNFPDGKIHTRRISFTLEVERPQIKLIRKADSGPLSVTMQVLCGNADESGQQ